MVRKLEEVSNSEKIRVFDTLFNMAEEHYNNRGKQNGMENDDDLYDLAENTLLLTLNSSGSTNGFWKDYSGSTNGFWKDYNEGLW